jgi:hypothetical protein
VLACADAPEVVWENHQESDNCNASSAKVDVQARPDLRQETVTNPPPVKSAGESFTVVDANRNIGDGPADSSVVRFWLVRNGGEPNPGGNVLLTGQRDVLPLAPKASSIGETKVTIPAAAAADVYSLLACSDDTQLLVEDIESNNCKVATQMITVLNPDLVENAVSNPPATAVTGASFSVQDATKNLGPGASAESITWYFLSTDMFQSANDIRMGGYRRLPLLAPGVSSTGTRTASVPAATPPGLYYVLACADGPTAITEPDELNNCKSSTTMVKVT